MDNGGDDLVEADTKLWTRLLEHLRGSKAWQDKIKMVLILGGGFLSGTAQIPFP